MFPIENIYSATKTGRGGADLGGAGREREVSSPSRGWEVKALAHGRDSDPKTTPTTHCFDLCP